MRKYLFLGLSFLFITVAMAQPQTVVADCTITFGVTIQNENGGESFASNMSKVLYIKGAEARVDIQSTSFSQSTICNNKLRTAVVLREINGTKYMTLLDAARWKEKNKKFEGKKMVLSEATKTILGYPCKKADMILMDGTTLSTYYATGMLPSTTENDYQFKDIPGLVLQYEALMDGGKQKITFTANDITLSPVPVSKFEIPKKGYRIL